YAVHHDFDRADRIVALDADFLGWGGERLRHAADFSKRRHGAAPDDVNLNRLYVVEPTPSITGMVADHRLPLKARDVERFGRLLARELGVRTIANDPELPGKAARWVKAVAADLLEHKGASVVVAGDWQPPAVHVLAHLINQHLDNIGKTVWLTERPKTSARTGE